MRSKRTIQKEIKKLQGMYKDAPQFCINTALRILTNDPADEVIAELEHQEEELQAQLDKLEEAIDIAETTAAWMEGVTDITEPPSKEMLSWKI